VVATENGDNDVEVDVEEGGWWLENKALFAVYREDRLVLGKSLGAFESIELVNLLKGLEQERRTSERLWMWLEGGF
jgi:hypothetical protein